MAATIELNPPLRYTGSRPPADGGLRPGAVARGSVFRPSACQKP